MNVENDTTPAPDEFSAAFAEFAAPGENKPEEAASEQPAEPAPAEEAAPAEPAAEATEAESEPVEETATETESSESDPVPEPEAPESKDDEILSRLSEMVRNAPKKEEPAPAPAPAAEVPEEVAEIYSDEEKAFLSEYEKDWGDVFKGERLVRRAEYRSLLEHVYKEVATYLQPHLDMLGTIAERTHLQDLTSKVQDYEVVREQVIDWVAKQPDYLQTAYNQVIQHGTVDQVADLIDRYKRDAGGVPKLTPSTSKKDAEPSPAAKQAAASMAPVSSKRSVIQDQDDPSNFDAAFSRFAGQLKS